VRQLDVPEGTDARLEGIEHRLRDVVGMGIDDHVIFLTV
jgi:hypothetical protein